MNSNAKIVLTTVIALLLIASAVGVKMVFFPTVKDEWFAPSGKRLRQAPKDLVIVRPTHFGAPGRTLPSAFAQAQVNGAARMVGRNVPLKDLIAAAYEESSWKVALPPNPPTTHYDYLVTVPDDPHESLRAAIQRKLGYTAEKETQDTDVLALKVADASLPGMKASPPDEASGMNPSGGRLNFKHQGMQMITSGLEGMLKQPVVDETGLTNWYDFSLVLDAQTQRILQTGNMDIDTAKKILANWGLALEPDTAPVEMLVVKKVY